MKRALKILSALGLVSAQACDVIKPPVCMYGCPSADYKVIGKVTDDKGTPVEGIKVSNMDNPSESQLTNKDGEFTQVLPFGIAPIVFEDIDGEQNGGEFQSDTLKLSDTDFKKVKDGDGQWYLGSYEVKKPVEVKLKKK